MAATQVFCVLTVLFTYSFIGTCGQRCSDPPDIPQHAHIIDHGSLSAGKEGLNTWRDGSNAYFECNTEEGYYATASPWWKYTVKCSKGIWINGYEEYKAYCKKSACGLNQHSCLSGACIDASKWCDCRKDCSDGSDEQNCPVKKIDISGRNSGTIENLFFPDGYDANMDCRINITTSPGKNFHLAFKRFDVGYSGMNCLDYFTATNLNYDNSIVCLSPSCPFCKPTNVPNGVSDTHWAEIRFVSGGDGASNHKGAMIDWYTENSKSGQNSKGGNSTMYIIVGAIFVAVVIGVVIGFIAVKVARSRNGNVPHHYLVSS